MTKRNQEQDERSPRSGSRARPNLEGLRVFIVEDEAIVSMLIEDTLADIGCSVIGTAGRLDEAIADAAYLDIGLRYY